MSSLWHCQLRQRVVCSPSSSPWPSSGATNPSGATLCPNAVVDRPLNLGRNELAYRRVQPSVTDNLHKSSLPEIARMPWDRKPMSIRALPPFVTSFPRPHPVTSGELPQALRKRLVREVAQEIARHSTADMTMNVYGRVNDDRLAEAIERIGHTFLEPEGVPEEYQPKRPQNQVGATHRKAMGCANNNWWRRRESNPRPKMAQRQRLRV